MKKLLIPILMGSLAATTAHATQFVTNGDFMTLTHGLGELNHPTVAKGWTSYGTAIVFQNATTPVHGVALWDAANGGTSTWNGMSTDGSNFVALAGDNAGPLVETISGLTIGKIYTLSFDYAFAEQDGVTGASTQGLSLNFGLAAGGIPWKFKGTPTVTIGAQSVANEGFTGWYTYTEAVTATKTSERLTFLPSTNLTGQTYALLSDVSLTSAVPEPATWAMMLVGMGLIGFAARRRPHAKVTYA